MLNIPMVYIWLALTIVFVIAEIATTNIVSIWFALGTAAATVVAWIAPQQITLQFIICIVVCVVTMYFTRPVLTKYVTKKTPTNMDMYIGQNAEVISPVSAENVGRVKIGGLTWQAKSNSEIAAGEMCKVVKIEGVSLVVEKISTNV